MGRSHHLRMANPAYTIHKSTEMAEMGALGALLRGPITKGTLWGDLENLMGGR